MIFENIITICDITSIIKWDPTVLSINDFWIGKRVVSFNYC